MRALLPLFLSERNLHSTLSHSSLIPFSQYNYPYFRHMLPYRLSSKFKSFTYLTLNNHSFSLSIILNSPLISLTLTSNFLIFLSKNTQGGGWPGTNDDIMKALEKLDSVLSSSSHSEKVIDCSFV